MMKTPKGAILVSYVSSHITDLSQRQGGMVGGIIRHDTVLDTRQIFLLVFFGINDQLILTDHKASSDLELHKDEATST
jgi:hypothetical protein